MSYEEKLRLAKEALDSGSYDKKTIEYIFPELENEDERIRKTIKYCLDHVFTNNTTLYYTTKEQCLSWLEKKGNEKDIHPIEFKLMELKATAYDDAKERLRRAYNENRCSCGFIDEIFPNLSLYEKNNKPQGKSALEAINEN